MWINWERKALDRGLSVYYNGLQSKSDDREQYPEPGQQEMGRTVQAPHRRGGKALWSAGRKWPAVSPRYGGRVCTSGTNSGGTTDRLIRPEPFLARGDFRFLRGFVLSPPGFAPGALVQQTQAQPVNRTGNKFCPPRAPVGPEKTAHKHS